MLLEQSGASLLQIWTLSQHLSKHAARCTNSSQSVQQSSSILGAVKLRVYNYNYNSPDILKLSEVKLNLQSATVPRQDKLPISSPYWLLHWTFWPHLNQNEASPLSSKSGHFELVNSGHHLVSKRGISRGYHFLSQCFPAAESPVTWAAVTAAQFLLSWTALQRSLCQYGALSRYRLLMQLGLDKTAQNPQTNRTDTQAFYFSLILSIFRLSYKLT